MFAQATAETALLPSAEKNTFRAADPMAVMADTAAASSSKAM
jgi:hypothetical protein